MPTTKEKTTHFGFSEIPVAEKTARVADVFHSVANQYDLMNDLMSLGIHRLWKRFAITAGIVRKGQQVLDVAGGTADITRLLSQKVGAKGLVVLSDINEAMLRRGRQRLDDEGIMENVRYVQANAEALPFPDNHFDLVTIAFGLRNVTEKQTALNAMQRVLRPGGRLLVLEFSKPTSNWLSAVYDLYSFKLLPRLGRWIAKDEESYRYLAESIRRHPDQETLKQMVIEAGFASCDYHNLSGGIVALHEGVKG